MKRNIGFSLLFVASICLCCGILSCNSNSKDELAHHDHSHHGHGHDHEHEGEGKEEHAAKEITLDPHIAKQMGVSAKKIKTGTFNSVIKVSGAITQDAEGSSVAIAPKSGTIAFAQGITVGKQVHPGTTIATVRTAAVTGGDVNAVAKENLNAAKKELDRVTPLYERGIVSASQYNAAMATYNAAKAAYSPSASGSATSPISGTITELLVKQGQYVEAGTPIAQISSSTKLTMRADVPQRYSAKVAQIKDARIRNSYDDAIYTVSSLGGKRADGESSAATSPGYIPIYFTLPNDGSFVAGTPVEVYLLADSKENVITLPLTALSEQQGQFFVYEQLDEDCYAKIPVKVGDNDGVNIEIISGLQPGQNIVVTGTVTVRLAESSGAVPEGHSHNH